MLKEFRVSNFRTLYDELTLSMKKENISELPNHLIEDKYLPVKLILGGNATGKTNVILAFEVLKNIVLNGGIEKKGDNIYSSYVLFSNLNSKDKYLEPITFYINFENFNTDYKYYLSLRNDKNHISHITYEKLLVDDDELFVRENDTLKINNNSTKTKKYFINIDNSYIRNTEKLFNDGTINHDNIFTNYLLFMSDVSNEIVNYFSTKLVTISSFDTINNKFKLEEIPSNINEVNINNKLYDNIIKASDFGNQHLFVRVHKDGDNVTTSQLLSEYNTGAEKIDVSAFITESSGTLKLLDYFPIINNAIKSGNTVVIDELDSSLNPVIIVGLMNLFTNNTINTKGAQLIFTTHNPVYLNGDILRRDEVEILSKDEDTLTTKGYTLADIKDVRKGESYLKNYLAGNYGPIHEIDFGDILE